VWSVKQKVSGSISRQEKETAALPAAVQLE